MTRNWKAGFWRLADPKISITSLTAMAVGAGVASDHPDFSWPWLLVLGFAMFCMEVAKNAWGDVYDYDSGTDLAVADEDRTAFSGGKRVLVDDILSRGETWGIAIGFTLAGLVLGAAMVFLREPAVFWPGLVGLLLGWSYHGPPLQLAYRGLGELDVVLCYGPVISLSSYVLMTGEFAPGVVAAALPLGILTAAFLWVNEFPDYRADLGAGKRNLVVQLGKQRAARALPLIYLLAFGLLLALPGYEGLPTAITWGLVALLPAALACWWVWRDPETFHRSTPAQPMALLAFVLYAAGATAGLVLAG